LDGLENLIEGAGVDVAAVPRHKRLHPLGLALGRDVIPGGVTIHQGFGKVLCCAVDLLVERLWQEVAQVPASLGGRVHLLDELLVVADALGVGCNLLGRDDRLHSLHDRRLEALDGLGPALGGCAGCVCQQFVTL
jgi:hypothetical protein